MRTSIILEQMVQTFSASNSTINTEPLNNSSSSLYSQGTKQIVTVVHLSIKEISTYKTIVLIIRNGLQQLNPIL